MTTTSVEVKAEDWANNTTLPPEVCDGLERFCTQLRDAVGEDLVSIVLYGGLTKGEYAPSSSDVNVMLVLRDATMDELDRAAPAVRQGMREIGLRVMVVTEFRLRRSIDVFPIKFLNMQRHHRVLWGKDVLVGLHVARDHLRLSCEQQIKNLLFRMRQAYVHQGGRPEFVESVLNSAISSFLNALGALLILKTGDAPATKAEIAEAASRELNLDEQPLLDALALKSGAYKPDERELKRLYGAFVATVERAADIVDRHEEL